MYLKKIIKKYAMNFSSYYTENITAYIPQYRMTYTFNSLFNKNDVIYFVIGAPKAETKAIKQISAL